MTGSMAEGRRSSRLMMPKTPCFWPEMKARRGCTEISGALAPLHRRGTSRPRRGKNAAAAALALPLRANLRGPSKQKGERVLERRLTFDLAADLADDPAQPAAQDAQLAVMPLELLARA